LADSDKVTIVLEAIDNTQGKIEAADRSLKKLNDTNGDLSKSFELNRRAADSAASGLENVKDKVHEAERAFRSTEKIILHAAGIIFALKQTYDVLVAAMEYANATAQETASFKAAEVAAKSLNDAIGSTINSLESYGSTGKAQIEALRAELSGAGTDSEKLRLVTLKLLELQGPGAALQVSIEQLRSQYKVESVLEDEHFSGLKRKYGTSQELIEKHFAGVLDIATREHNSEFAAASGNLAARVILDDQYKIRKIEIEKEKLAALDALEKEKVAKDATLEKAQLETTAKGLANEEEELKESFNRREIDTVQYVEQLATLISKEELLEIAALDNTVDKDEKANQIKIANAKKLAIARGNAITQELNDEIKANQAKERSHRETQAAIAGILGAGAQAAKLFGREGFIAWKALALAQAIISGANAVLIQLGGGDAYSAIFRAAAAGALAAVQIATIAATQPSGYAEGGLIPGPPSASDNRLAMVATGEYIFDAPTVARAGAANIAAMHEALRSGDWLSISGGMIPKPSHRSSFASGGLVGPAIGDVGERIQNVSVGFLNSRQEQIDFMRRSGTKILVDQLNRRSQQIVS